MGFFRASRRLRISTQAACLLASAALPTSLFAQATTGAAAGTATQSSGAPQTGNATGQTGTQGAAGTSTAGASTGAAGRKTGAGQPASTQPEAVPPVDLPASVTAPNGLEVIPPATPVSPSLVPSYAPPVPLQSPKSAPAAAPAAQAPSANADMPASGQPTLVGTPQPAQTASIESLPPYDPEAARAQGDFRGSAYIPVDSPIYPMALRLYSLGYLDSAFLSMRPWTYRSLLHMLEKTSADVVSDQNDEAMALYTKLKDALADEDTGLGFVREPAHGIETVYTRMLGISGPTLRDSYHLGQTLVNDYGRPYASGFNNVTGFSTREEWWRLSFYLRGEFQHAPAFGDGYSYAMANQLSCTDLIAPCPLPVSYHQDTIPYGNTGAQTHFRLQEAAVGFHVLGHEISGGKTDAWFGPGYGGAMAWSNNAEDVYSFRINRVEPLSIPLISKLLGPLRYDFLVGSLKGHTIPNDPWVHSEIFSFRPTKDFQFAFERTVIWGGKGHVPITLGSFFRSFFSLSDTTAGQKYSRQDPGARYSDFSFSYRLPILRHYVTLYADSITHDDVTPVSAPRRAAYRPGIYLSQIPGAPKWDLRVEAASTDTSTLRSQNGQFNYYEIVQLQGYTNKGFIFGDWIGREAKGGQAWLTWHRNANEWVQFSYLNKKTPKDFIPGGTTQNQFKVDVLKRLTPSLELDAWVQYERWKAPVYAANISHPTQYTGGPMFRPDQQSDTAVAAQFTWYPKKRN